MHRNLTNLIFVLGILFIITACVCRSDRDQEPAPAPQNSTNSGANVDKPSTKSSPDSKAKKNDEGDFLVEYVAVTNPKYTALDREVRNEKLLEKAADRLNRALILPHDIVLRAKDCGEVNAFYDPESPSVTVCYELMEHFFKLFRGNGVSEDKAYAKMFDAVRFVFLHEVGHALIDTYKLPITGNEEDAADRCSSYINLEELGADGLRAVVAAADAFAIESKQGAPKDRNMADEHLLQEQRFYNSLCMIYGSNPAKYENIVTDGYLPKERAVRCQTEYQKTVASWINLLAPWRKG